MHNNMVSFIIITVFYNGRINRSASNIDHQEFICWDHGIKGKRKSRTEKSMHMFKFRKKNSSFSSGMVYLGKVKFRNSNMMVAIPILISVSLNIVIASYSSPK